MKPLSDTDQRRELAEQLAASRRELEELVGNIHLASEDRLDSETLLSLVSLLRDLRAELAQAWHRANAETQWEAGVRGPVKSQALPSLIQNALIESLVELEIDPHFVTDVSAIWQLIDPIFPDGTAMELAVGGMGSETFPVGRLGVVVVPATRYVALLGGWMVSRRHQGEEWPKRRGVRTKIGPLQGERWSREDLETFLADLCGLFHRDMADEVEARGAESGSSGS